MAELLCKDEVYAVVGAAMEVYNELGAGFLEQVYQEALENELAGRGIPFEAQKELQIRYKGRFLKKTYQADMIAFGKVIVELKALDLLTSREESQMLNYLKAAGLAVGLLINFGAEGKLEWKRLVKSRTESANKMNLHQ
jgi:GxxExxY protein